MQDLIKVAVAAGRMSVLSTSFPLPQVLITPHYGFCVHVDENLLGLKMTAGLQVQFCPYNLPFRIYRDGTDRRLYESSLLIFSRGQYTYKYMCCQRAEAVGSRPRVSFMARCQNLQ